MLHRPEVDVRTVHGVMEQNRAHHMVRRNDKKHTDMELSVVTDSSSECEMARSYVCEGPFAVFLLPWRGLCQIGKMVRRPT